MVNTRILRGTKEQIAREIERVDGKIISAILIVEETTKSEFVLPGDEEFLRMMKALEADAVSAPHADDSREAIYTRMPGE